MCIFDLSEQGGYFLWLFLPAGGLRPLYGGEREGRGVRGERNRAFVHERGQGLQNRHGQQGRGEGDSGGSDRAFRDSASHRLRRYRDV